MALHELVAFSSFPYTNSPISEYEERARQFAFSFKNGRGCPPKHPAFADVVRFIVADIADCPAFAQPCIIVPVPRSGNSRKSFERGAPSWPCIHLAEALVSRDVRRVFSLLERQTPVERSSDGSKRISVDEHLLSMKAVLRPDFLSSRLVLVDDLLTRGTQMIAALLTLRRAGYSGPIAAYCVHQTIAPAPLTEQRSPYLKHTISWHDGQFLASRADHGRWRQWRSSHRTMPDP